MKCLTCRPSFSNQLQGCLLESPNLLAPKLISNLLGNKSFKFNVTPARCGAFSERFALLGFYDGCGRKAAAGGKGLLH